MKGLGRKRAVAAVTVIEGQGRAAAERETRVRTLEELFDVCRDSAPGRLVRVSIVGTEGEVRLTFASFRRAEKG